MLERIKSGKQGGPPRLLVYGIKGIGKSLLAAAAPKPIFISTEDGLGEIDCDQFPLATKYSEVIEALRDLATKQHDFQTVVIDSVDWLERLIWDHVCERFGMDSGKIEKVDDGFGKGYTHALKEWMEIKDALSYLRHERGMTVILTAHAKVEKFEDPDVSAYDRYSPRLNKHASATLCEWCDAVLFATQKIITKTEDAGFGRKRTIADGLGQNGGDRVLRCVNRPSSVAANRYGLPAELPLDWPTLHAGIIGGGTSTKEEEAE